MSNVNHVQYHSILAPIMSQFIAEKHACGYKYDSEETVLKRFDMFLCDVKLNKTELPENLVLQWLAKRPSEQAETQQQRIVVVRQLGRMMQRVGYPAYIVPNRFGTRRSFLFSPYIFNKAEICKLMLAADEIKPQCSLRHIIMPEIFRLLYGCGFRVNEVLNLRVRDVDLKQGVITVRNGKFAKDRLVPPSLEMVERLRAYVERLAESRLEKSSEDSYFFPAMGGLPWSKSGIYTIFRQLLYRSGISHGGPGKGPRVHDLRHTFAVHRLIQWHEEGADLNAKMPLLIAYLGHQDFTGTQKYLHLTAELFPNLTERMNAQFGNVIPRGR